MAQRRRHILNDLTFEPARASVRGWHGEPGKGRLIVDSPTPLLVWEPRRFLPYYAFPRRTVDMSFLRPTQAPPPTVHGEGVQYFDLVIESTHVAHAAWSWPDPQLDGAIAFDWEALDHWFEEDDEMFGHPRDPYHRVDLLPTSRHVQVHVDGALIADSRRTVLMPETLLPGRFYFDRADIDTDLLTPSELQTVCPYKGFARYWTVHASPVAPTRELAWAYEHPLNGLDAIAGRIAFLDEAIDVFVDAIRQRRPRTQWSEGIRTNMTGGGSGHGQAAHGGADDSIAAHR